MNLSELRVQIDDIDSKLVELFLKRMEIVENVARYKIENGMQVFQSDREQIVIDKAKSRAPENMAEYVAEFFTSTMAVSRHMQQDIIDKTKK